MSRQLPLCPLSGYPELGAHIGSPAYVLPLGSHSCAPPVCKSDAAAPPVSSSSSSPPPSLADAFNMSRTLWVGDLDAACDEAYIFRMFNHVAQIVSCKIIRDKVRPRCTLCCHPPASTFVAGFSSLCSVFVPNCTLSLTHSQIPPPVGPQLHYFPCNGHPLPSPSNPPNPPPSPESGEQACRRVRLCGVRGRGDSQPRAFNAEWKWCARYIRQSIPPQLVVRGRHLLRHCRRLRRRGRGG